MLITITGTPGAGKTYIAKRLKTKDLAYIDLNALIKKERLYDSYDRLAKTYDVSPRTLKKLDERFKAYKTKPLGTGKESTIAKLKDSLKGRKGIIIDSHMSHFISSDLCIVVKCDVKTLHKRLKKRNYPPKKMQDNTESEIFDIILHEAEDLKRNIVIIHNGKAEW